MTFKWKVVVSAASLFRPAVDTALQYPGGDAFFFADGRLWWRAVRQGGAVGRRECPLGAFGRCISAGTASSTRRAQEISEAEEELE